MQTMPLAGSLLMAVTVACHFLIQTVGSLRLRAARDKIGGTIRGRSDLDEVRAAIQTNLLLGVLVICNGVLMVAVLFWLSKGSLWAACVATLAVGQTGLWIIYRPIEKQFKALAIAGDDAELAIEYRCYVKQWGGCHLFLKPAKKPQEKEPSASPNGGPAAPAGNSRATEGPPSVS